MFILSARMFNRDIQRALEKKGSKMPVMEECQARPSLQDPRKMPSSAAECNQKECKLYLQ